MAAFQPPPGMPRTFVPSVAGISSLPTAPPGTFLPGTKVQVGNHRVVIDRYLSEGGFAHVYVVTLPRPVDGREKAVLKRVAVPNKEHLANMRTEVETMKRLRGQKQIVKYIDSHASSLKGGGYEVFLLMEWCNGGGLIDFMNTRLQNRLTEPEILKIFTDVAEGVACMHYLKPPLLHRDLKIENVLITSEGKSKTYKLCDFGSAAPPRPAATTAAEGRLIEDDVQRHTTLQYRSPEMIDVYRKQPIDEKSDIWALGCFLYKLCYYTTPFEEAGQTAILNASFKYPGYPRFSDDLKLLIASMLREQPSKRPNIYQVLVKACKLDGRSLSIQDIYTGRSRSVDANRMPAPTESSTSETKSGATLSPPKPANIPTIPQVEPMRRGRPLKPVSAHTSAKPSPSPLRMMDSSDPFAQLDGGKIASKDELSGRFPKLEEFSLMSDRNSKFAFEVQEPTQTDKEQANLQTRVTEALADDAFARPSSPPKQKPIPLTKPGSQAALPIPDKSRSAEKKEAELSSMSSSSLPRRTQMVSTGTMTSPSPTVIAPKPFPDKPIWRVPVKNVPERASTITQASSKTKPIVSREKDGSRLAQLLQIDAANSQGPNDGDTRSPGSSRPSLEGGRPLLRDLDSGVQRSRSLNVKNRPASVNMGARPTNIRDQEITHDRHEPSSNTAMDMAPLRAVESENNIKSDIDFLKAKEEEEKEKTRNMKRLGGSTRHQKRASLPSMALSGTKNILHGRFGDAFKRFEGHGEDQDHNEQSRSPEHDEHEVLTPIAGSEATDLSDDRRGLDETEELSPELRRELEKQKLEAEERRVERAAAEYRQRVGTKGAPPPVPSTKAASIQNRVQSLLKENERPAQRTATGYGKYTIDPVVESTGNVSTHVSGHQIEQNSRVVSAPASQVNLKSYSKSQRPAAPPKPHLLRSAVPEPTPLTRSESVPLGADDTLSPEDWETRFSQRYPSLSHLEMVETDIESKGSSQTIIKEI